MREWLKQVSHGKTAREACDLHSAAIHRRTGPLVKKTVRYITLSPSTGPQKSARPAAELTRSQQVNTRSDLRCRSPQPQKTMEQVRHVIKLAYSRFNDAWKQENVSAISTPAPTPSQMLSASPSQMPAAGSASPVVFTPAQDTPNEVLYPQARCISSLNLLALSAADSLSANAACEVGISG